MSLGMCLYPIEAWVKDEQEKMIKLYELVIVEKNKPGYTRSKYGYFPTEVLAWEKADELNMDMGLYKREQVREIVSHSMKLAEKKREKAAAAEGC